MSTCLAADRGLTCLSGVACVYRVVALPTWDQESQPSGSDVVTMMSFTSLQPHVTHVAAAHFAEVLAAVNAVRAASGAGAVTWSGILPAGVPVPTLSALVRASHVVALRTKMDEALAALGIAVQSYDDPNLAGSVVRAYHIEQIRERSQ
jgi:hypothetical protein